MDPIETLSVNAWADPIAAETSQRAVDALEDGKVLFLPELGFPLEETEQQFLSDGLLSGSRKNITFDPKTGASRGSTVGGDAPRLEEFISRFARSATSLMHVLVPQYGDRLQPMRATFRPAEIAGRTYDSPRKDDRFLHVDAFPSRPTQGRRILRLFTNINPEGKGRLWHVGEQFEDFASSFLPRLRPPNNLKAWAMAAVRITRGRRSPYDDLMLQLHDGAKMDANYQATAPHFEFAFPAQSTWICFTDRVLHAALAGQFVLEQTFHLDVADMVDAERAPIRILERLTGTPLL